MSYYHGPVILRLFSSKDIEPNNERHYSNLGEWTDTLNLSWAIDELVPVCYSTSFAVKSKHLLQNSELFYNALTAMKTDYEKHEHHELVEFMKRSMAAIFSHPLPDHNILQLKEYSTGIQRDADQTWCIAP